MIPSYCWSVTDIDGYCWLVTDIDGYYWLVKDAYANRFGARNVPGSGLGLGMWSGLGLGMCAYRYWIPIFCNKDIAL